MGILLKYFLLAITLTTAQITFIESRQNSRRKTEKPLSNHFLNICNPEREWKVHCFCNAKDPKSAKVADCWVFNGGTTEENEMWPGFSSQPYLEKLNFTVKGDGSLTYIPTYALQRLQKLQNLAIEHASIPQISSAVFSNSSTLREITLKDNQILRLDQFSFSNLIQLTKLSLEENGISELRRQVFFGLPNLQTLQLSFNNISTIQDGCFEHLSNLKELQLDSNAILVLTRETFQGLANLETLDLSNNELKMLGDQVFAELRRLTKLLLDDNELTFISEWAFKGLSQLRRLSLMDNKLYSLETRLFEGIGGAALNLRNNKLETLSYQTMRPIIEKIKTNTGGVLQLEGNPFICDCRLSWIHRLLNETRYLQLRQSLAKITCIMDPKMSRRSDVSISANAAKCSFGRCDYDDEMYEDEKNIGLKKLVQIAADSLPCPDELKEDSSVSPPTQDEVKMKATSSGLMIQVSLVTVSSAVIAMTVT